MTKPDRGLDWLNLILACMGSAYGAFIPVYLTAHAWTQTQIGTVLTIATVAGMVSQVPAGLLVDVLGARRRTALLWAIVVSGLVPVAFALWPRNPPILLAMVAQAVAGAVLSPSIAATSLAVAGRAGLGERAGRNGRFGSIGAGVGAAIMGACGYLGSQRLIFVVAALLLIPAVLAARAIGPDREESTVANERQPGFLAPFRLLRDPRLLIFASCVALFQVGSIAVLQLSAVEVTARLGGRGALVIAALLIVPQLVVAVLSPWIGRRAERIGHRPTLLAGFATVPLRGVLFAIMGNPYWLVPVQVLEGLGGATFGVMLPLVAADLTYGKGNYTLCLSLLGLAGTAGTALSTVLGGFVADRFGHAAAFWALAVAGLAALTLVAAAMPETRRASVPRDEPRPANGPTG